MKRFCVVAMALLCACSAPGDSVPENGDNADTNASENRAAAVDSFSLHCTGAITEVANEQDGVASSTEGPASDIYYQWKADTGVLTVQRAGGTAAPFCTAENRMGCEVNVNERRLFANDHSMKQGEDTDAIVTRDEIIDINLFTLTGSHVLRTEHGAASPEKPATVSKSEVTAPLNCERTEGS
jgi:hypothetical protein